MRAICLSALLASILPALPGCGGDTSSGGSGASAGSTATGGTGGGTGAAGGNAGTGASGGNAGTGASGGSAGTGASGGNAGTGASGGSAGTGAGGGSAGGGSGAGGADAGPDAISDSGAGDVDLDSPLGWVGALDGVWLIGWWGNLNHYSWVRISSTAQLGGVAEFNDGHDLVTNSPYWPCNGTGSWMVTQKPDTIGLYFPSACSAGFEALTFESFQAPTGYPHGADLAATVTTTSSGNALQAYHFPSSQCDVSMTTCIDPL